MSALVVPMPELQLGKIPIPDVKDFIRYYATQEKKKPRDILEPFLAYENDLRKIFAQAPDHPVVADGKNPNLVSSIAFLKVVMHWIWYLDSRSKLI